MRVLFLALCFVFLGLPLKVGASGFNLKSIGEVNTEGKQISKWWYSGTKPVFRGEALPGADVDIVIDDGEAVRVSADSAGDWVYTVLTSLTEGDHSVLLTSGGVEIKFTLVLGASNVDWGVVESGSASALPAVGFLEPTIMLSGMGLLSIWLGKRLIRL